MTKTDVIMDCLSGQVILQLLPLFFSLNPGCGYEHEECLKMKSQR